MSEKKVSKTALDKPDERKLEDFDASDPKKGIAENAYHFKRAIEDEFYDFKPTTRKKPPDCNVNSKRTRSRNS